MMSATWVTLVSHGLLAQAGRYDELSSHFQRGGSSVPFGYVLGAAVLAVVLLGVIAWWSQRVSQQKCGYQSRRGLFRDLCRLHELPSHERRTLRQLARVRQLTSPSVLFLRSDFFDTADVPVALQTPVETLRRRLFGVRAEG